MTFWLKRLRDRVVVLREGEAVTALMMFAYSFLAMTGYNIIQPITRSKFISSLGADNLPYVQLAAGVIIGVLMQLYGRAIARLPRRFVLPVTIAGEVGLLVLFWFLFKVGPNWISAAFYVLGLILGILLISQFWTLANVIYDARQAKRLFGFIGGGASLGGAMGAAVTSFVVDEVGTDNLLLVSAAVLSLCIVLVTAIARREGIKSDVAAIDEERGVGGGEAIRMLRTSRHLQVIALVITCAALGAAFIDQQLNMAAASVHGSTDAITGFLAQVRLYLSLVGFVVQVGLTSQIHRSLGLLFALLILPVSLGSTAVIILLTGALWAPAAARVLDSSLRYSIDKTTREVLFLPLPAEVKYRVKPFVDVTVDRFAKATGALLLLGLIKPWGLHLTWQRLSYASLAITCLWIVAAMQARAQYLKTFRRSIETHAIQPATVRLDVADPATIETLVEELSSHDESSVLYAIDMLEALEKRNLITPLLLHHESPRVRARTLFALDTSRAERWRPAVERMLRDQDVDVRAAAVHALSALSAEGDSTVMRLYLNDPEPRVAATAAAMLADAGDRADADAAEAALRRLAEDTRDAGSAGRKEAAAALARVRNPRLRPLLLPLMYDGDLDVAREAIRSAGASGPPDPLFVPALIARLGHRVLKPAARDVLIRGGDDILDALTYLLTDEHENIWVRRHIPGTLARFQSPRAMNALLGALDHSDGFLRYKALTAIERRQRDHDGLVAPTERIEKLVLKECSRYYNYLTLRQNIVQRDGQAVRSLLVDALNDKLGRTLDRIYRLLGLLYPWKDVSAARSTIARGDARARASAIEYLDNLLKGSVRKLAMPILDDTSIEEKVRYANFVLKTRPRDLEDTLVQLVYEEDQVVAAAAIHFVERRQLRDFRGDLEYLVARPPVADGYAFEAASWALASHRRSRQEPQDLEVDALPAVELADRLRAIPLFNFISVDELFRVAHTARQTRREKGQELCREQDQTDDVRFLLEGSVAVSAGDAEPRSVAAPAALAFEETLEGRPLRHTILAAGRIVCLTLGRNEFLTMISDNVLLAQGLFRMVLDRPLVRRSLESAPPRPGRAAVQLPLSPLEKVLLLRQHRLFERATVDQLLDVAAITREILLAANNVLFTDVDQPAIYHIVSGEMRVDGGAQSLVAGPGSTIGIAETLAGVPLGRRATVTQGGYGLRIDHDELYEVLADHIDLLQGLFSGMLDAKESAATLNGSLQPMALDLGI